MLLINESDIKPEIIKIFDEIKSQLISVNTILNNINNEHFNSVYPLVNLKKLITKILNDKNFNISFETYLNNNDYIMKNELSLLMSVINLDKKLITEIEEEYNTKLPKEYKNKNDIEVINEFKKLILKLDKKKLLEGKENIFNDIIKIDKTDILMNFVIKNILLEEGYKRIISFLKTEVNIVNKNVNIKYFNKLFNIDNINLHVNDIERLDGIIEDKNNVVIAEKNNSAKFELINLNDLEQINGIKAVEMGLVTTEFKIKYNNFYIDKSSNIFIVSKESPILNMEIEDYNYNMSNPDEVIEKDGGCLTHEGLLKIRNNIFLRKNNWQKGSIIKFDNTLMYLTSNIKIVGSEKIEIQGVLLNNKYKFEYYLKNNMILNKKEVKEMKQADDFEKLFFLEIINSSYNITYTNKNINRTEKRLGLRY